jgi:hypothetical protein
MPHPEGRKKFAFDRTGNYSIRVLGFLDENWSERLGGLSSTACRLKDREGPVTTLVGQVRDQAELTGVLNTLYQRHLTLLSVEYLDGD